MQSFRDPLSRADNRWCGVRDGPRLQVRGPVKAGFLSIVRFYMQRDMPIRIALSAPLPARTVRRTALPVTEDSPRISSLPLARAA